jgi:hypothetical protein
MKEYKINFTLLFLVISFLQLININASAEIIDDKDEEKQFGDWKSFCKVDLMMGVMDCKIASKFYENAVITIEPNDKLPAKINLVIANAKIGEPVKIRIDKNNIIQSKSATNKDFGMVSLDNEQKDSLYNQMLNGEFLFLRFNLQSAEKEITVKIQLKDFRNALAYINNNH